MTNENDEAEYSDVEILTWQPDTKLFSIKTPHLKLAPQQSLLSKKVTDFHVQRQL